MQAKALPCGFREKTAKKCTSQYRSFRSAGKMIMTRAAGGRKGRGLRDITPAWSRKRGGHSFSGGKHSIFQPLKLRKGLHSTLHSKKPEKVPSVCSGGLSAIRASHCSHIVGQGGPPNEEEAKRVGALPPHECQENPLSSPLKVERFTSGPG